MMPLGGGTVPSTPADRLDLLKSHWSPVFELGKYSDESAQSLIACAMAMSARLRGNQSAALTALVAEGIPMLQD
eukprot:3936603-Rhodomonas_salina.1